MSTAHGSHQPLPDRSPRRRAVNVTVSADLLLEAREFGIGMSATLEEALRAKIAAAREARWLNDNREAVEDYNRRLAQEATFGSQFGNL